MAARKAKPATDDGNASDFIRAQPVGLTAPEVVESGRRAGFDFSTSLVYAVRGRMKKGTAAPAAPKRERQPSAAPRRAPAAPASRANGARLEQQIEELVGEFVERMAALVRRAALDAVRDALERGR